jgi:small subunit ribosomal protein S1
MNSNSIPSHKSSAAFSMDDFAQALENYDYQFSKGTVVRGKVFEINAEGAYVDIGGKSPGFVPAREAALGHTDNLATVLPLNEELEFLIIGEQNAEGQVTLSRRQLALKEAWEKINELAESGSSVQMRVTGFNKGGVTGEVEGLRSFIPRSHLQEKDDLDRLIGQLLTATFLEVNQDNNKLILSQRDAIRAAAMTKLEEGALMTGKIVSLKPYGVFVNLNGVTGLLHIKEVSNTHIDSLTTVFKVGQEIKVVISHIDEYKNRLSLSTKILEEYPGELMEHLDQVMATAEERLERAKQSND